MIRGAAVLAVVAAAAGVTRLATHGAERAESVAAPSAPGLLASPAGEAPRTAAAAAATVMNPAPAAAAGRSAFWIGASDLALFDQQTVDFISSHGALVVLNVPETRRSSAEGIRDVVARFHRADPALPVLLYAWATRWSAADRIGGSSMEGYAQRPLVGTQPRGDRGAVYFGDLASRELREWMAGRLASAVQEAGANGVGFDVAISNPAHSQPVLRRRCAAEPAWCGRYAAGLDSLVTSTSARLGSGLVLVNGLYSHEPGMLAEQERLLRHADGGVVEFFGLDPTRGMRTFEQSIEPYLDAMRRNQDRILLVAGRGPPEYADYLTDYAWQRYLYAMYLQAAGERTHFHYHSSFQVPAHAGRTGGIDVFADWEVALGAPSGPSRRSGDLFIRPFANGRAVAVRQGGRATALPAGAGGYTPEGTRVAAGRMVAPGEGLLLLDQAPAPRPAPRIDLARVGSGWDHASFARDASGGFLRVGTRGVPAWWSDVLLDGVRSLRNAGQVDVEARGRGQSWLALVAEVDDARREDMYAAVLVPLGGGAGPQPRLVGGYRSPGRFAIPAPVERQPARSADGWARLQVDGAEVFPASGRYTFRRWSFLRVLGDADLRRIELR